VESGDVAVIGVRAETERAECSSDGYGDKFVAHDRRLQSERKMM
jgi:hypothetical protein